MSANLATMAYIAATILFILSLGGLSHPETARRGNLFGIIGMTIAVLATVLGPRVTAGGLPWIIGALVVGGSVGLYAAKKVQMTQMPELVAIMHSLVGLAACLVGFASYVDTSIVFEGAEKTIHEIEIYLGIAIGAVTFSGSVIAFGKLQGIISGKPVVFKGQHALNALIGLATIALAVHFALTGSMVSLALMTLLAFLIGVTLIIPIGGADMPVVVSMLNSYSGWAAAGIGFSLNNSMLIIAGSLVGSSGAILSYIMCKAMNRSLANVIFGGFGAVEAGGAGKSTEYGPVRSGGPEEAAMLLESASRVMIVPGYGLAVAQAQHTVKEMADLLAREGIKVDYAIHPVAGRMPGHMNVLLAEADVPYEQLIEMDTINPEFKVTDAVLVVGANDVVNPAAEKDPTSPIAGMPVLEVWKAKTSIVMKRSMASGYAGVDNPLFYKENNRMLFGDAKKMLDEVFVALRE